MARSIEEIQEVMLDKLAQQPTLAHLTSASKTATWRLWIYIVAYCIHNLEKLFDFHRDFVENKLLKFNKGRLPWYRKMALDFQYGFNLIPNTDKFDNTGKTDEDIEVSKIVKYCAVNEAESGRLILKIAAEKNKVLSPVDVTQQTAFKKYIDEIKYGGVRVTVINYPADLLRLNLKIVRNPLVLTGDGMNIFKGSYPVDEAIKKFLKELPFNGEFSIQKLESVLLDLDGVVDLATDKCDTAYIDGTSSVGYGGYESISIRKIPFAGYFKVNLTTDNEHKSIISYV